MPMSKSLVRLTVSAIVYSLFCIFGAVPVWAQSPVVPISTDPDPITMTAVSCLANGGRVLIPTGTFQLQIVDGNGKAAVLSTGDGLQVVTSTLSQPITSGTMSSIQIPNPAKTSLTPYFLHLSILDSSSNKVTNYPKIQVMLNDVPVSGRYTQFNFCKANTSLGLTAASYVNVGVVGPAGPTGPSGSGCASASCISQGLVLNTQQATLKTPVIYDHFLYADGTVLSTQTAESGNSQWSVNGAGTPTIVGGYLTNSYGVGGNVYVFLPNTATDGGSTSALTSIGGTFKFCPALSPSTYDPTTKPITIAGGDLALANAIHLNFGPTSWDLLKKVSGVLTDLASGFYTQIPADCATEHQVSMLIDVPNGKVTITTPDGVVQPTITDSGITTVNPQNGWLQIGVPGAGAAEGYWGSFWMGGPTQSSKFSAAGKAAPMGDVTRLQGAQNSQRWQYPPITVPNAAGGGGTGWYRIATHGPNGPLIQLNGDFTITDTVGASTPVCTGYVHFHANASKNDKQPNVVLLDNYGDCGNPPIDQIRFSTDNSVDVAVDIHLSSAYTTYASTLNILGVGILAQPGYISVGATALAYGSTVLYVPTNAVSGTGLGFTPPAFFDSILTGGAGWYTAFINPTSDAGYGTIGNFQIQAYNTLYGSQLLNLHINASVAGCGIWQTSNSAYATTMIDQYRCSWSGGAVQIDIHDAVSSTYPVEISGTATGFYAVYQNPTVGAVVLGSGSNTYSATVGMKSASQFNIGVNPVLPSTLTGYHGNASGTKVQLSDNTGTSVPAFFDANGNLTSTAAYGKVLANCGTMTTTAATSNTLACAWVTTTSTCMVTPSNSTTVAWTYYVPTAGNVQVFHASTAGATYALACSVN